MDSGVSQRNTKEMMGSQPEGEGEARGGHFSTLTGLSPLSRPWERCPPEGP